MRQDGLQLVTRTKQLGAALRVVDGHAERQRREGGKDAPEVVPHDLALNLSAEQRDARAKHHLRPRLRPQHLGELLDRIQWRRQVAVPEADDRTALWGRLLHGLQHASADGLGLAAVGRERQQ